MVDKEQAYVTHVALAWGYVMPHMFRDLKSSQFCCTDITNICSNELEKLEAKLPQHRKQWI